MGAHSEVDPSYFQDPEHRPKPAIAVVHGLPVIDLAKALSSPTPSDLRKTVSEIRDACRDWGFFQVVNHGVDAAVRERVEAAARRFFALPLEEKRKVRRDEVNPLGYYDVEHTKNVRDWKEVFDYSSTGPIEIPASGDPLDDAVQEMINQWPENPPEFKEACEEYMRQTQKLAFKLLELISLSLGLGADRLKGFFEKETSFVRLNHYPPCPVPHLALGVGRHKDAGALTVLAQDDVGGLEVKRKADGEWIAVQPIPNAYIINVGDIIQVWSNAEYESAEHRAIVNPEKDRISIPLFFNPAHYTMVEPLEELISDERPSKYKAYNWGKFFSTRKRSNLKKLDVENIQIDHFKVEG
uniref:Fe2OG dioxygenase domain-containing protein n=1 Tax=Kalanchoe fedtschenkoi TaxID=63787 RepID=A0A7N0TF42_KALFE